MYIAMLTRQFVIEAIYSVLFLVAFHRVCTTPFEMFVIFGLFTIFLRTRMSNDFAEIRAQNYLLLRLTGNHDENLSKLTTNMFEVFDADELLSQFSDKNKKSVAGDYSGQIFGRLISQIAQAWMLLSIAKSVL